MFFQYNENHFRASMRYITHSRFGMKRNFIPWSLEEYYQLMMKACQKYKKRSPFDEKDDFDTMAEKIIDIIGENEIDEHMLYAINYVCAATGSVKLAEFVHSREMDLFYSNPNVGIFFFAVTNGHTELVKFYLKHAELSKIDPEEMMEEAAFALRGDIWAILVNAVKNPKIDFFVDMDKILNNIEEYLSMRSSLPPLAYWTSINQFYKEIIEEGLLDGKPQIKQEICTQACEGGVPDIVTLLVAKGAEISHEDKKKLQYIYKRVQREPWVGDDEYILAEAAKYKHYYDKDYVLPTKEMFLASWAPYKEIIF